MADPVTVADMNAQRMIETNLRNIWPSIPIVGEEGELDPWGQMYDLDRSGEIGCELPKRLQELILSEVTVWIDPVDGTKAFVHGLLEHVTTLVGIAYRGKALAGIVAYPFLEDAVIWGVDGVGVFGATLPERQETEEYPTGIAEQFSEGFDAKTCFLNCRGVKNVIKSESAGNMCMQVLQGKADVYIATGTCKWDSCAPEAILRAAGGHVTDRWGKQLWYHKDARHRNDGMLATIYDHHRYIMRPDEEHGSAKRGSTKRFK